MAETTTTHWTDDGTIYYYDRIANSTQREPPAGYYIPFEVLSHQPWTEFSNHRNVPFWGNSKTGKWTKHMPEVYLAFKKAQEAPPGYTTEINRVHRISPNRANTQAYQSFGYLLEDVERGGASGQAGWVGNYGEEAEEEMVRLAIRLSLQESLEKSDSKKPATGKAPKEPVVSEESEELAPLATPGKCYSCFEEDLVTRMPCGHSYCAGCVAAIFIQAMELDTFDQPKCCGILLPLDFAGEALGKAGLTVASAGPSPGPSSTSAGKKPSSVGAGKKPAGASKGKKLPAVAAIECFICMGDYALGEVLRMPCSHHYCRACLRHHFVAATTNETLYPPKCCEQEIPATLGNLVLSIAELQKFKNKKVEFRTKNRLYCWYARCSAFIEPTDVAGEVGECKKCKRRTCIHCKNAWHYGECLEDKNAQEMLKMAQRSGWKRCYDCRAMLELADGCNHMTCKCGAQFCYTCGRKWKTCECQMWRPDNLERRLREVDPVDRAEHEAAERVAREMERARVPPPVPQAPYFHMMPPVPPIPYWLITPPGSPEPPPLGYHYYGGRY